MAQYWSENQLDRATPPQVLDQRGKAILRVLNQIFGSKKIPGYELRDAQTCPAAALPALIAEHSMEEFIDPDLPEHIQRRILKQAWLLQTLEGYDAGVKLGLGLLGITAEIEHWWQVNPKRQANTHTIFLHIRDQEFGDDWQAFSTDQIATAWRMINSTKRQSQDTTLTTVEEFGTGAYVSPSCADLVVDDTTMIMGMP